MLFTHTSAEQSPTVVILFIRIVFYRHHYVLHSSAVVISFIRDYVLPIKLKQSYKV